MKYLAAWLCCAIGFALSDALMGILSANTADHIAYAGVGVLLCWRWTRKEGL